jgi:predicted RNA binding protein YcfA (HicA-like mRNA interferase family)
MNDFGKAVRQALSVAGCVFPRHGKGDHDMWITASGKKLIVPMKINSRHTANGILKDAGLRKAF